MRNATKIIAIIVLLGLNVIVFYNYKIVSNTLAAITIAHREELAEKERQISANEELYQNIIIAAKENENLKLDRNLEFITEKGDTILAKDAFKDNRLVLRYSVLNCNNCVDAEFKNLELYAKQFSKKVIIITFHERLRDLIMVRKKLKEQGLDGVAVYMLTDNKLAIPIERYNIPYYFCLSPELTIRNVFVPLRDKPKLSEYYLKHSFKNFF